MASHQDWRPVVLEKRKSTNRSSAKATAPHPTNPLLAAQDEKKFLAGQNRSTKQHLIQNAKKIEEDTGDYRIDRVSSSFSSALQKARMNKKLTQAQLAQLINEKTSVVNEYESGKAIPNGAIIQKLNRALGVQLPSTKKKSEPTD